MVMPKTRCFRIRRGFKTGKVTFSLQGYKRFVELEDQQENKIRETFPITIVSRRASPMIMGFMHAHVSIEGFM